MTESSVDATTQYESLSNLIKSTPPDECLSKITSFFQADSTTKQDHYILSDLNPLCDAINRLPETQCLAVCKCLIQNGIHLNQENAERNTPLLLAIRHERDSMVSLLLKHGAHIHTANSLHEISPLYVACQQGNLHIVKLLLDHSSKLPPNRRINVNLPHSELSLTALHAAVLAQNVSIVKVLVLDASADVDSLDYHGDTPLAYACREGQLSIAEFFIEHGANIIQLNEDCETPMVLAAKKSHKDIVSMLKGAWRMLRFQQNHSQLQSTVSELVHDVRKLMSQRDDLESYLEPVYAKVRQMDKEQQNMTQLLEGLFKESGGEGRTFKPQSSDADEEHATSHKSPSETQSQDEEDVSSSIWNEMVDEFDDLQKIQEERRYYQSIGLIQNSEGVFQISSVSQE